MTARRLAAVRRALIKRGAEVDGPSVRAEVEHRYGDGAWSLARAALEATT